MPPGIAPREVREAWIGLILPLVYTDTEIIRISERRYYQNKSWLEYALNRLLGIRAWRVKSKTAIELLERRDPAAASWWRENRPNALNETHIFRFPAENCLRVSEQAWLEQAGPWGAHETSAPKPKRKSRRNSLVYYILLIAILATTRIYSALDPSETPKTFSIMGYVLFGEIVLIAVASLYYVLQEIFKAFRIESRTWRMAYSAVLITVFSFLAVHWFKDSENLLSLLNNKDPELSYDLKVSKDGQELLISGDFALGLSDEVEKVLKDNANIKVVSMLSDGGRLYEGLKVGKLIKSHNLSTFAYVECDSACTLAFIGGKKRFLRDKGRLGFHRSDSVDSAAMDFSIMRNWYESQGVQSGFIDKVMQTSSKDIWYPTDAELKEAGVTEDIMHTPGYDNSMDADPEEEEK
jgi:hypothetical protein